MKNTKDDYIITEKTFFGLMNLKRYFTKLAKPERKDLKRKYISDNQRDQGYPVRSRYSRGTVSI